MLDTRIEPDRSRVKHPEKKRPFIDWERVRADYVHGYYEYLNDGMRRLIFPSLRVLAEKYGINSEVVSRRCRKEKWVIQKEQFKSKIMRRRYAEIGVLKFRETSRYDADNIVRLEKFGRILDSVLDYKEQCDPAEVDLKELKTGFELLEKMHKLGRDIFGEPVGYDKAYEEAQRDVEEAMNKGKEVKKDDIEDLIKNIKKNIVDVNAVGVNEENEITHIKQINSIDDVDPKDLVI